MRLGVDQNADLTERSHGARAGLGSVLGRLDGVRERVESYGGHGGEVVGIRGEVDLAFASE